VLSREQQTAVQARLYPELEEEVFGALHAALSTPKLGGAVVLDAGCGKGSWILDGHKGLYGQLVGTDIYAADNRMADGFAVSDLGALPFQDASFDLLLCYVVMEHLERPADVLAEFARVLAPGGVFVFKTPYAKAPTSLLTRLVPNSWHARLKGTIGIADDDVFPTYFRCNTPSAIRRLTGEAGFIELTLLRIDQTYAYLSMTRLTYAMGLIYSRATRHPALAWLRNGLVGICRKGAM
jgi:SAM-dependent methyltransferase